MNETLMMLLIGLGAGLASGFTGIGGGIVMVPALVFVAGMTQHLSQGTSSMAIMFTAISGTLVHLRNQRVVVGAAIPVGLAGAVTAFLGAWATAAVDPEVLQRLFGLLMLYGGGRLAWTAFEGHENAEPVD